MTMNRQDKKAMKNLSIIITIVLGMMVNAKGSELTNIINESYADEGVRAYEYRTVNVVSESGKKCAFQKGELELESFEHGRMVNGKIVVVVGKALTVNSINKIDKCL